MGQAGRRFEYSGRGHLTVFGLLPRTKCEPDYDGGDATRWYGEDIAAHAGALRASKGIKMAALLAVLVAVASFFGGSHAQHAGFHGGSHTNSVAGAVSSG